MKVSLNMNNVVWVKIGPAGVEHLRRRHELLRACAPSVGPFKPPVTDADGWSRHQLWTLFENFGDKIHLGMELPFGATIRLTDPALDSEEEK